MEDQMQATIVGTGDGGTIHTPHGQPNITITVVAPLLAIIIRSSRVFLNTLLGLLSAQMVTDTIPANDFKELFFKCAGLSVAAGCVAALTSAASLLTKLEEKFPTLGV